MGVVDISNVKPDDIQAGPATAADATKKTTPPPGITHSLGRAFSSTMAGLDQLVSNASAGVAKVIPGPTPFFSSLSQEAGKEAEKRRKELEADTASGGAPQTTGEKLTEGVGKVTGAAIPYLAAEGPVGNFAVGALENADQGVWPAIKGGAEAALNEMKTQQLNSVPLDH